MPAVQTAHATAHETAGSRSRPWNLNYLPDSGSQVKSCDQRSESALQGHADRTRAGA
jgi:hypothetical protein